MIKNTITDEILVVISDFQKNADELKVRLPNKANDYEGLERLLLDAEQRIPLVHWVIIDSTVQNNINQNIAQIKQIVSRPTDVNIRNLRGYIIRLLECIYNAPTKFPNADTEILKEKVDEAEGLVQELKQIVQPALQSAESAGIEKVQHDFSSAKSHSFWFYLGFSIAAIIIIGCAIAVAYYFLKDLFALANIHNNLNKISFLEALISTEIFARIGLISLLIYLSGYLISVSNKHRLEYFKYRDLESKLNSFELYIANLPNDEKIKLRENFTANLFSADNYQASNKIN